MKILIQLSVLFLFFNFSALAEKITVFEFTEEEMTTLKEKKVFSDLTSCSVDKFLVTTNFCFYQKVVFSYDGH